MNTLQIRITQGLLQRVDSLIDNELYSSRSDVIRDALRRFLEDAFWKSQIGSIPNTGDSVKEIRELRKKLSKEPINLDEINN